MEKEKIELSERKAAFVLLKDFCIFSMGVNKERGDFLEVTEWSNGEGYDIDIHADKGLQRFQLTAGQFDAIKKCIKQIHK
jgi:hypothetical protein